MAGSAGIGGGQPDWLTGNTPAPISPTSQFGNPSTFTAAANTQASDYDTIMAGYKNLAAASANNPITAGVATNAQTSAPTPISAGPAATFNTITPQTTQYEQSGDVSNSLSDLSNLAATGGYTDAGIQEIRARDTSPIRSIYSNAQQNIERSKALNGGYSPNYAAATAKLSRDEASEIGDTVVNANAGIAQNVASNKIAATPAYAAASASANAAKTAADQKNADIINQANALNSQGRLQADEFNIGEGTGVNEFNSAATAANDQANANRTTSTSQFNVQEALDAAKASRATTSDALKGATTLYGTTPALTNTFGNQVVQAAQLGQNQQSINNQKTNIFGNLATRFG